MPDGDRPVVPLWRQRRVQVVVGVAVLVVVGLVVGLVWASGGDDDAAAPASTTTAAATGDTPPIAPLTGLPDPDLVTLIRPVLTVKIDDVILDRRPPQAGLELADVVYEEPVEGATRFAAMFQSRTPERVGPVRSTRFLDPGIVWPVGGEYVYSGGTPDKVAAIDAAPVQTFDETALAAVDARVRDPAIPSPHNLFAIPQAVWDAADDHSPPPPLFRYLDAGQAFPGEDVETVTVPMSSTPTYTWDAASGTWPRQQAQPGGGVGPHLTESGAQVAPTNLVVQRIAGLERDDLLGEGDAWLFSAGRMVVGRWRRATLDDVTTFTTTDGRAVELTPGSTWVHLVTAGEPEVVPAG